MPNAGILMRVTHAGREVQVRRLPLGRVEVAEDDDGPAGSKIAIDQ